MPQINDFIGWMKKNNLAAHAARFNMQFSAKGRQEIFIFEVLTTMQAHSSKYFILCFCMKAIHVKQV